LRVGSNLSHIDRLLLLVLTDIVDGALAAVLLAVLDHEVAIVEEMEGTVAREEQLTALDERHGAAFGDMERVARGSNESVGNRPGIYIVVGEL
jgi:hypothetical protein